MKTTTADYKSDIYMCGYISVLKMEGWSSRLVAVMELQLCGSCGCCRSFISSHNVVDVVQVGGCSVGAGGAVAAAGVAGHQQQGVTRCVVLTLFHRLTRSVAKLEQN